MQSPIIPVVGELIARHPGTISLGQGVVHYGPPPRALQRLADFAADGENHKYKAVEGIAPLRRRLACKLADENAIPTADLDRATAPGGTPPADGPAPAEVADDVGRVVVTAGGNLAFVNALLAVADPGDEILLPAPYYFNHEMAVTLADCRPVPVPTDDRYQLRLDALERAITPRTRAIVTVSPNNPSGAVYPPDSLRRVNELCRRRGLYHLSDEAYEYFTHDGARHFSPGSLPGAAAHTLSLFSFSKAYGFASWRVGYMVIPGHLAVAVKKIQDTILICPPVICQYAALGALDAGADYCREHLRGIARVRQIALEELARLGPICTVPPAEGAFYFLLKVHGAMPAMELVERLIREHGVAVIPGTTFGMADGPGGCYLRVSYGSLQAPTAAEGLGRLVRGLREIVKR